MSKNSRSGGKYTGNHTTLIPLASLVCDMANAIPHITKISPGFITSGIKSLGGKRRVKFSDESNGSLLLVIRDNASTQEVRMYTTDLQAARTELARRLLDQGIAIRFKKDDA